MPIPEPTREGTLDFRGCQTWYRVTGDLDASRAAGKAPLVVLHGGPGIPHDYTLRIAGRRGFVRSPTILIDGVDPFGVPGQSPVVACRVYVTPAGLGCAAVGRRRSRPNRRP